ncbi:hypothetical protein ADUPG1_014031, partial [Aduncisulcus paluster]
MDLKDEIKSILDFSSLHEAKDQLEVFVFEKSANLFFIGKIIDDLCKDSELFHLWTSLLSISSTIPKILSHITTTGVLDCFDAIIPQINSASMEELSSVATFLSISIIKDSCNIHKHGIAVSIISKCILFFGGASVALKYNLFDVLRSITAYSSSIMEAYTVLLSSQLPPIVGIEKERLKLFDPYIKNLPNYLASCARGMMGVSQFSFLAAEILSSCVLFMIETKSNSIKVSESSREASDMESTSTISSPNDGHAKSHIGNAMIKMALNTIRYALPKCPIPPTPPSSVDILQHFEILRSSSLSFVICELVCTRTLNGKCTADSIDLIGLDKIADVIIKNMKKHLSNGDPYEEEETPSSKS